MPATRSDSPDAPTANAAAATGPAPTSGASLVGDGAAGPHSAADGRQLEWADTNSVSPARRRLASLAGMTALLVLLGYLLWSAVRPTIPGAAPRVNPAVVIGLLGVAAAMLTWAYVVGQRAVVRAATERKGRGGFAVLDAAAVGAPVDASLGSSPRDAHAADATASDPAPAAALARAGTEPRHTSTELPWPDGQGTTDPEARAAWDTGDIAAHWSAGSRYPWFGLVVSILSALLLAFMTWSYQSRSNEVVAHATRITAPVVDGGWTFAGLSHRPWVDVTYPGDSGMLTARLPGVDPASTPVGTQLTFIADDRDETRVQAITGNEPSAGEQWLRFWLGVVSLLGLLTALRAFGRRSRTRRTLQSRIPLSATAILGTDERLYAVAPTSPPVVTRLPRGIGTAPGQSLLLVGADRGSSVQVDDGARLISCELPSSYAQARRYVDALATPGPAPAPDPTDSQP